MNERFLKSNFLEGEIFKRHFEENVSEEELEWLNNNWLWGIPNEYDRKRKMIIVRTAVFCYEKKKNKEKYSHELSLLGGDINIVCEILNNKKQISNLFEISKKYSLYVPYMLYPVDIEGLISEINYNNYEIAMPDTFKRELKLDEVFELYGLKYREFYRGELTITIDFRRKHENQNELLDKVCKDILIYKDKIGLELAEHEEKIFDKICYEDISNNQRLNSFNSRLVGILIWDIKKENRNYTFKQIRERLVDKKIYKYKGNNCLSSNCNNCIDDDNCLDAFKNLYKVAAGSIQKKCIIKTSETSGGYNPNPGIRCCRVSIKDVQR